MFASLHRHILEEDNQESLYRTPVDFVRSAPAISYVFILYLKLVVCLELLNFGVLCYVSALPVALVGTGNIDR